MREIVTRKGLTWEIFPHTLAAMLTKTRLALVAAALAAASPASAQDRPREVEVSLSLPRTTDGRIDSRAVQDEARRQIGAGATEIHFRGDFSQEEARRMLLDGRLLRDLGATLPNDGIERDIRLRGEVEARIQRDEADALRARIENIDVGNLTGEQRAELARQLAAQGGLERVRIRGADPNGERVRVEFREGRGITRNEGSGRAERAERAERTGGSGRR